MCFECCQCIPPTSCTKQSTCTVQCAREMWSMMCRCYVSCSCFIIIPRKKASPTLPLLSLHCSSAYTSARNMRNFIIFFAQKKIERLILFSLFNVIFVDRCCPAIEKVLLLSLHLYTFHKRMH